jgi:hypothetical protein
MIFLPQGFTSFDSGCDEIPLCKIIYFVRGMGLLAEYIRCGHTTDHKTLEISHVVIIM